MATEKPRHAGDASLTWLQRLSRRIFRQHYRHIDALYAEIVALTARVDQSWLLHEQGLQQLREAGGALEQQLAMLAEVMKRTDKEAAERHERLAAQVKIDGTALAIVEDRADTLSLELSRISQVELPRLDRLSQQLVASQGAIARLQEELPPFQAAVDRKISRLESGAEQQRRDFEAELRPFQATVDEKISRLESGAEQQRRDFETEAGRLQTLRGEMDHYEHPIKAWFDYTAFEDKFRGTEAEIKHRQSDYLPLLSPHAPVLDLGCGRGELLELLQQAGIECVGVEFNALQAERCAGKGLRVEQADFLQWLPAQRDGAFGAITALQVVEHVHLSEVHALMREAYRKLRPGGLLLIETVNPHNPLALEWFYIDPTHRRPVYPEMIDFLLRGTGYENIETRFQMANPAGPPADNRTGMDYAVWGYKPSGKGVR